MANYITTLRDTLAASDREVQALRDGMRELLAHMATSKFSAPENAWIATGDVARRIHEIEASATDARENGNVECAA